MQEVGWPDPAAVVDIIERMLSLRAFSLMASTVEAEGAAEEIALIGMAPLRACDSRVGFYRVETRSAKRFRGASGTLQRRQRVPIPVAGKSTPIGCFQQVSSHFYSEPSCG
jgi:hypothetical protein